MPGIGVRKRRQRSASKPESSMGREPAVCTDGAAGLGVTGRWVGAATARGREASCSGGPGLFRSCLPQRA